MTIPPKELLNMLQPAKTYENVPERIVNYPRADFKPELFDSAIETYGYTVLWEQGMFCSCYRPDTGQPDYNCVSCAGKGYVYFNPTYTKAVIASISGYKDQQHIGLYDAGSAYLTPKSQDDVGFRDRFTMVDFRVKISEVITKSDTTTEALRYPADKITRLAQLDTEYLEGHDFTVSQDGLSITWTGRAPLEGTSYAVLYTAPPVYIAVSPVHDLRGTYTRTGAGGSEVFVKLPKQFQIKREDFLDNV